VEQLDNSVVKMEMGLVNSVLGRIFGTGEREAKYYIS